MLAKTIQRKRRQIPTSKRILPNLIRVQRLLILRYPGSNLTSPSRELFEPSNSPTGCKPLSSWSCKRGSNNSNRITRACLEHHTRITTCLKMMKVHLLTNPSFKTNQWYSLSSNWRKMLQTRIWLRLMKVLIFNSKMCTRTILHPKVAKKTKTIMSQIKPTKNPIHMRTNKVTNHHHPQTIPTVERKKVTMPTTKMRMMICEAGWLTVTRDWWSRRF